MDEAMISVIDDKFYTTARAFIVDTPLDLPREIASAIPEDRLNPSFLWIAGRYVQANKANKNGHYWTLDDIKQGEYSIKYTPMNVLHQVSRPVGTFVETKIIDNRATAGDESLPEVQALAVLWSASFPNIAKAARDAHAANSLWFSMECVAEKKECLDCGQSFAWETPAAMACVHMAKSNVSPRRFINPIFLGGALIFPPERPAWKDADVTEVARVLVEEYAHRSVLTDVESWESVMGVLVSKSVTV